jgi:hypothetical protein
VTGRLSFRRLYAYATDRDYAANTLVKGCTAEIPGNEGDRALVRLFPTGRLHVRAGYSWDGASGPAFDTAGVMEASFAHDVLYELIGRRLIPWSSRKAADQTLRKLCLAGKVPRWRATYIYCAVRLFGGFWLDPIRQLFPRTR